jgi:hypothetical protein
MHPIDNGRRIVVIHATVNFCAVASGYDSGLINRANFLQGAKRLTDLTFTDCCPFPDVYGGRVVIESEREYGHNVDSSKIGSKSVQIGT